MLEKLVVSYRLFMLIFGQRCFKKNRNLKIHAGETEPTLANEIKNYI